MPQKVTTNKRFFEMMKNNIESLKGAEVGKWTTQRMTNLAKSFSDWSRDLNNIVIATQNKNPKFKTFTLIIIVSNHIIKYKT